MACKVNMNEELKRKLDGILDKYFSTIPDKKLLDIEHKFFNK